jgi:hypothetical protein
MNNDGLYHQPRWVNAIFIAGCVPIILSPYVMKDMSRPLVFIGGPLLFLFVGFCNKWRSGAFLPRWAEAAQLRDQLDLEKARRLTQAELALLAAEISAYDVQPRSLRTLSEAVQHIATGLSINVHEDWLEADHRRPNEAVRFHYRTTIVQAELRDGGYHCACSGTTVPGATVPGATVPGVTSPSGLRTSPRSLPGGSPAIPSIQRPSGKSISRCPNRIPEFRGSAAWPPSCRGCAALAGSLVSQPANHTTWPEMRRECGRNHFREPTKPA